MSPKCQHFICELTSNLNLKFKVSTHPQLRHIFLTVFFFVLLNLTKVVLGDTQVKIQCFISFTQHGSVCVPFYTELYHKSKFWEDKTPERDPVPCQGFEEHLGQRPSAVSVDIECGHPGTRRLLKFNLEISRPQYHKMSQKCQHRHLVWSLASSSIEVSCSWSRPHLVTVTTRTFWKSWCLKSNFCIWWRGYSESFSLIQASCHIKI